MNRIFEISALLGLDSNFNASCEIPRRAQKFTMRQNCCAIDCRLEIKLLLLRFLCALQYCMWLCCLCRLKIFKFAYFFLVGIYSVFSICDKREHESNKTDDAMRKTFLKHKINKILTTIKVQRQSSWNL